MNNKKISTFLGLMLCALMPLAWSSPSEAPLTWLAKDRDGSHSRYVPVTIDHSEIKMDWQVKIKKDSSSISTYSLMGDGSHVLVSYKNASDENSGVMNYLILNSDTGSVFGVAEELTRRRLLAFYNSSIITEGGEYDPLDHDVQAFDVNRQQVIFKNKLYPNDGYNTIAPLVSEGLVYLLETKDILTAIDAKSGSRVRSFYSVKMTGAAVNQKFLLIHGNRDLTVYDRINGKQKGYIFNQENGEFKPFYRNLMLVGENRAVFTVGDQLEIMDLESLNINEMSIGEGYYTFAADQKNLFTLEDRTLRCIDLYNRKIKWRLELLDESVDNDYRLIMTTDNLVIAASNLKVIAISKATRKKVWEVTAQDPEVIMADQHLYVLGSDLVLTAYRLN